ncbi:hypothetical protein SMACR_12718 [Sordaria macrospora]|uniref:Uncharacterized protein n=1 Tax=Sordaria macrospora TaxID=5147 RepID=A0A8S9A3L1_SORMA|nr:hypothetical protein SMACR_12718 [Sordaria macrospora]
MAARTGARHG